jgi:hypothetical protein
MNALLTEAAVATPPIKCFSHLDVEAKAPLAVFLTVTFCLHHHITKYGIKKMVTYQEPSERTRICQ